MRFNLNQTTENVVTQNSSHINDLLGDRNTEVPKFKLYHYTVGGKVKSILESGYLKPTDLYLLPHEKPVLWFSRNPRFEYTSKKTISSFETGHQLEMDFDLHHKLFTNVRFEIECNPKDSLNKFMMREWNEINVLSNTSPVIKKNLERIGRRMGGNPREWCGTLDCILLNNLNFQVWNSDIEEWCNEDIHSWVRENGEKEVSIELGTIIEHRMKKNPKGWMLEPYFSNYHSFNN